MALPNLIIGGSYRAGTTSVFSYLSGHPQVCGSRIKETAFFIREFCGDRARDAAALGAYFGHCGDDAQVRVEASAGYLQEAKLVAPRIKDLLGTPRLLFMLRSPADRLYSYFNYLVGQLELPQTLSFEQYVNAALARDAGRPLPAYFSYSPAYLEALAHGRYSRYLERFYSKFDRTSIKVALFEDLERDVRKFMSDLSVFAGLDPEFYGQYSFGKVNASFLSRNATLHRLALFSNRALEPVLRHRRGIKTPLVALYKRFNMARDGYHPMSAQVRRTLLAYYADDLEPLEALTRLRLPDGWRSA